MSRRYQKHGVHGTERALSKRGLSALDGRSAAARSIKAWMADIASDHGGESELSTSERTILRRAAEYEVVLVVGAEWMRANPDKVFVKRKRAYAPVVAEYTRLASAQADLLKLLGMKRRVKVVLGARELMALGGSRSAAADPPSHSGMSNESGERPRGAERQ